MLGYLAVNGSLTFKKSYEDHDYYDLNYFAQHTIKYRGNDNLVSKRGKGSRTYTLNKRAKKRIENATILMRHFQNRKTHAIKFLTLTFKNKLKKSNKAIKEFFNHMRIVGSIKYYWWVKEYHPKHYERTGEKKEHYHCLVCIEKFTTKKRVLEVWQQKTNTETIIIDLQNIRVRNKYNSFSYQIVRYVSKYCTKGIDKFNDCVYNMSDKLKKQKNIPVIYAKTIKKLLQNISQNENLTENEIIYYREHWNQAYLKVKQAETYFKIKKEMENDSFWQWLYLDAIEFEDESPKQAEFKREIKKITQQKLKLEKKFIY